MMHACSMNYMNYRQHVTGDAIERVTPALLSLTCPPFFLSCLYSLRHHNLANEATFTEEAMTH